MEELELQPGKRRRAPAEVGTAGEDAEARARRVDERAVEAALVELAHVGVDDPDVRDSEALDVLLELARRGPRWSSTAVTSPCEHRRLRAGSRAGVEDPLAVTRADDERGQLGAPALPDAALVVAVDAAALEPVGARDVGRLADRRGRADDELGGLVLGAHQRQRLVGAEVAHPGLVDPVGIRLGERPGRERGDERREAFGQAPGDRVREAGGMLEPGARGRARPRR